MGAPASRAQYHPHQPPVGHFFLAIFAAPATAGARAIAPRTARPAPAAGRPFLFSKMPGAGDRAAS